jgi:uncharacterized SAM-binding protein YcdF (DUF218 family)
MFFVLSKSLAFLTVPSNDLILAAGVGAALLFTRFERAGRISVALSIGLIAVAGLSPLGPALVSVLEERFPPWDAARAAPIGFIILGGAIDPEISEARASPALNGAAERITIVAELALRYPSARFIFSGGNANMFGGPAEADQVMRLFESFGISPDRIVLERRSRNTVENAVFSKELAAPKPGESWAVVTSAIHMPRAIGAFRAAGFDVAAYPVDWRTRGAEDRSTILLIFTWGLAATDAAAHEFLGLVSYWLTRQSSELFPGPK